ncbi:MAG: RT0821/Lpp0805 family surface protein [Gammaproteobacteria bacterium]|nr:RT0821/Lpp0805 family surface protein [Gammaproteobacteria bacterium]
MKTRTACMAAILAAQLAGAPSYAVDWRLLDYSPVRSFNDADWALYKLTGRELLDKGADGETRTWENPDSGSHGALKAVRTYKNLVGLTCRQVKVMNATRSMKGETTVHVCKQAKGNWQLSEPPASKK